MCGSRQMGALFPQLRAQQLVEERQAQDQAAAPAPEPPAPAYSPGPYGPRTTVTNALPSTDMPNAGGQAAGAAAETLQIPATMAKRNRGSYRTAGIGGLNVPGVG